MYSKTDHTRGAAAHSALCWHPIAAYYTHPRGHKTPTGDPAIGPFSVRIMGAQPPLADRDNAAQQCCLPLLALLASPQFLFLVLSGELLVRLNSTRAAIASGTPLASEPALQGCNRARLGGQQVTKRVLAKGQHVCPRDATTD